MAKGSISGWEVQASRSFVATEIGFNLVNCSQLEVETDSAVVDKGNLYKFTFCLRRRQCSGRVLWRGSGSGMVIDVETNVLTNWKGCDHIREDETLLVGRRFRFLHRGPIERTMGPEKLQEDAGMAFRTSHSNRHRDNCTYKSKREGNLYQVRVIKIWCCWCFIQLSSYILIYHILDHFQLS